MFYTNYNKPERKPLSFSNTKQKVYKATTDSKGIRHLMVDKEIDVYEKIQEYAEDTKITNLLQRYNLDMLSQLKDDKEQLIDLTNLPTNLMETMQIIDDAKYAWDRQSKDIKAKFNNDFKQFIAASETGQLAKLLNDELKVSAERFQTANMANFNAQSTPLQSYPQQSTLFEPTPVQQQTTAATMPTSTQQGVNLNV